MKNKLFLAGSLLVMFGTNAVAEEEVLLPSKEPSKLALQQDDDFKVDRSQRSNPYANTPSYAQGGDTSRYSTSQGWSRGRNNGYWWGGRAASDIPTTGYTTPSSR